MCWGRAGWSLGQGQCGLNHFFFNYHSKSQNSWGWFIESFNRFSLEEVEFCPNFESCCLSKHCKTGQTIVHWRKCIERRRKEEKVIGRAAARNARWGRTGGEKVDCISSSRGGRWVGFKGGVLSYSFIGRVGHSISGGSGGSALSDWALGVPSTIARLSLDARLQSAAERATISVSITISTASAEISISLPDQNSDKCLLNHSW